MFGDLDADSADSTHRGSAPPAGRARHSKATTAPPAAPTPTPARSPGAVSGTPDHPHKDTVTIALEDASGEVIERDASATVAIRDVLPAISVTKVAAPDYVQDSGPVTYTAVVTNTSVADTLTIDQLSTRSTATC